MMGIAAIYAKNNQPDKALAELKKAEQANPGNRKVHLMMASVYEQMGDTKQAEYEYLLGGKGGAAPAPKPAEKPAATVLPVFKGDLDKEIAPLKQATRQSPDNALAAYEKMGDT